MNIEVNTHNILQLDSTSGIHTTDTPEFQSIRDQLSDDYDDISEILSLDNYIEEGIDMVGFFEDIQEYPPPNELPEKVIDKLDQFSNDVIGNVYEYPYHPSDDILKLIFQSRKILSEQLSYIYNDQRSRCNIWMITAKLNGHLYGLTFVFHNPKLSNVVMQGISRSFAASLIEILRPGTLLTLPRLNSLLLPAVEALAKNLSINKISVVPIGNQGKILKDYYGFQLDNHIEYPCEIIKDSTYVISNMSNYKIYSKIIPWDNN